MKNHYYLGGLVLLVLVLGLLAVWPGTPEEDSKVVESQRKVTGGQEKRSSPFGGVPVKAPVPVGIARWDQARRVQAGLSPDIGRTFVLPPRNGVEGVGSSVESSEPADVRGSAKSQTNGASTLAGASLELRAVAHKRGRHAFMKKRYNELAAHTPGCKCAYHGGKKR